MGELMGRMMNGTWPWCMVQCMGEWGNGDGLGTGMKGRRVIWDKMMRRMKDEKDEKYERQEEGK